MKYCLLTKDHTSAGSSNVYRHLEGVNSV